MLFDKFPPYTREYQAQHRAEAERTRRHLERIHPQPTPTARTCRGYTPATAYYHGSRPAPKPRTAAEIITDETPEGGRENDRYYYFG